MTKIRWEEAYCPICGPSVGTHNHLNCPDRLVEPDLYNYLLVKCTGCGLIYLNPRPVVSFEDPHDHQEYDPFLSIQNRKSLFTHLYGLARRIMLAIKVRLIRQIARPKSTILDIGCGTGEFLAALKNKYEVNGVETESKAAAWAHKTHNLNVFTGTLKDAEFDPESFDVITMWHVLEHIPDPQSVTDKISKLLKPGGYLVLGLPNISSLDAHFYGKHWIALDAPRHLWHFSRKQVVALAEKNNFKLIRCGILPFDLFYNILLSEKLMLSNTNKLQLFIAPIRIFATVLISFLVGIITNSYSSMYYVLRKN